MVCYLCTVSIESPNAWSNMEFLAFVPHMLNTTDGDFLVQKVEKWDSR